MNNRSKQKRYPTLSALKGRIRELETNYVELAEKMGMSATALSNKINGRFPFTVAEMEQIAYLLDIAPSEIVRYFMPTYCKTQRLAN